MVNFASYQPFGGGQAVNPVGQVVPMATLSALNQSQPQQVQPQQQGGMGQQVADGMIKNGVQQMMGGTSADARQQLNQALADRGNPVAQSILNQPAAGPQPAATASNSSLMQPMNKAVSQMDSSPGMSQLNSLAGNQPGNGFAQQAFNGINSFFNGSAADGAASGTAADAGAAGMSGAATGGAAAAAPAAGAAGGAAAGAASGAAADGAADAAGDSIIDQLFSFLL